MNATYITTRNCSEASHGPRWRLSVAQEARRQDCHARAEYPEKKTGSSLVLVDAVGCPVSLMQGEAVLTAGAAWRAKFSQRGEGGIRQRTPSFLVKELAPRDRGEQNTGGKRHAGDEQGLSDRPSAAPGVVGFVGRPRHMIVHIDAKQRDVANSGARRRHGGKLESARDAAVTGRAGGEGMVGEIYRLVSALWLSFIGVPTSRPAGWRALASRSTQYFVHTGARWWSIRRWTRRARTSIHPVLWDKICDECRSTLVPG